MALINSGFNGTVDEVQAAQMSNLSGADAVESAGAWAVTQGVGRQVSVAAQAGYAFAKGVLSKDTAPITAALSTPVNGQWFLIVRHIDWTTNAVTVVAVPHTATTTVIPTVAPVTFPVIDNNPGVLYDQKLGWAWVRSTDTTVTLFDLRTLPVGTRLAGAETLAQTAAAQAAATAATVAALRPYAIASGKLSSVPSGADTAILLPVGRFTQPPTIILTGSYVTASGATGGGVVRAYSAVNPLVGFSIRAIGVNAVDVEWLAVQMTAASGQG